MRFLFIFSAAINALYILPSLIIIAIYDRVLSTQSSETLLVLIVLALGAIALMVALEWIRSLIVIRVSNCLDVSLYEEVIRKAFEVRLRGGQGDPSSVISDLGTLRQLTSGVFIFTILDLPWVLLYLLIIGLLHPAFALLAIAGGASVLAFSLLVEKTTKKNMLESRKHSAGASRRFASMLRSSETVWAMGSLARVVELVGMGYRRYLIEQSLASDSGALLLSMNKGLRLALQFMPIALGAYLALKQEISPGVMFAASILTSRAIAPLDLLSNLMKSIQATSLSVENLRQVSQTELPAAPSVTHPLGSGRIELRKASVIPPGAQDPSVVDISLRIEPGEAVAIVGPSSSGKSSFAKLLVGAWAPAEGEVRIDGATWGQYSEEQRMQLLGYLPQEVDLFEGTVTENIARFSREIDESKVLAASQFTGLHELILKLPNGYDTLISEGARNFSGGFRQRVGLARALYGQPRLVVLDEPNSNLDDQGEASLRVTIERLKKHGSTVVLITHRASLLSVVDRIVVLMAGKVVRQGPRDEFLKEAARPAPVGVSST